MNANMSQTAPPVFPSLSRLELNTRIKQIGVLYWIKLMREGIPRNESRTIAAAIAKFRIANRRPTSDQKLLIVQYSALICRAGLWHSDLLVP
ncbi:MAG: hypothetical protein AAFX95_21985 [Cyanobacteria bacterium J06639_16]